MFLDLVAGSDWIPFQESRVFHTHITCRSPSVSYIYSQLDVVFVFNLYLQKNECGRRPSPHITW